MIIIDASAAVDLAVVSARGSRVRAVIGADDLLAPELLDAEVCSALARLERAGTLTGRDLDAAVRSFGELPVRRVSHQLLCPAAWAHRHRVRVADAFYLACSELAGAALVTCDARLARSGVRGAITLVR